MVSFTVETRTDVYNINFIQGKMILTNSLCNYVTSGYFSIMRFFARKQNKILSFQRWDFEGNCTFNYVSLRKMFA